MVEYITKRNAENRIELRGSTDDVAKVLSESTLYIMTSNFEGMPNALMEAMAVGIPAISTDCPCGGPRLVTMNGNAGFLVECGDYKRLAYAMQNILVDFELQKRLSKAEQKRALDFKEDCVFVDWNRYLEKVIVGENV